MEIVSGYGRKCKDGLGGIKKIWLMPYVKYSRSQIITDDVNLLSFPESIIYEFVSIANPTFSETVEFSDGGDFYNQTISLTFAKKDAKKLRYLKCGEYRIIIQDNNNVYHIFGLYTGLQVTGLNYTTGGSKPELNGIRLDFTAKEEKGSFFLENLDGFFDNGTEETFYLRLESGMPLYTQNNNNLILQNG
jgi:hypothetical protein